LVYPVRLHVGEVVVDVKAVVGLEPGCHPSEECLGIGSIYDSACHHICNRLCGFGWCHPGWTAWEGVVVVVVAVVVVVRIVVVPESGCHPSGGFLGIGSKCDSVCLHICNKLCEFGVDQFG
jgi:hypothetical protein